jgi:hypothetical protein
MAFNEMLNHFYKKKIKSLILPCDSIYYYDGRPDNGGTRTRNKRYIIYAPYMLYFMLSSGSENLKRKLLFVFLQNIVVPGTVLNWSDSVFDVANK